MYLFEPLKELSSTYLSKVQVDLLKHAYIVAREAHDGQMRSSGDPYITHPVAVALNLAHMHLDHETLMAALLHDVIEDTNVTKDELAELFGHTVAELVEGVSKLDKLKFDNKEEMQAENFRKMVLAMVQDIRVILIKLADRTHNMRTLGSLRPDKRRRIARETLEIYAPIANRLGIHDIKNELELLGFQALYPMRSRALKSAVKSARGNRKAIIDNIQEEAAGRLKESNISAQILGREKHLYSIYRKMLNKELMFNEVMDIYAFRVIVDDSIDDCYRALGAMHNLFKPIEGRFKDYIAIPKTNGYRSLHTSLIGPHGIPVEVQIRTKDMDQMADKGVAAHWLYKEGSDQSDTTAQMKARRWMQSLLELQQSAGSSFEFIENVKSDLFPEEIYVFTPEGRIIELPMGATAVDFAYAVHTDIGNSCVGVKVDRKPYPMSQPLDSGQTIEVITSAAARPNATWLNFVVTAKARLQIRTYLRSREQTESKTLGSRLLSHALGKVKLEDISKEKIAEVVKQSGNKSFDELLTNIGLGNALSIGIARRLTDEFTEDSELPPVTHKAKMPIKGTEGMLVSYGKCCRPIPGDVILAYLSPGKGLMVHQQGCRNIKGHEPGALFPVKWDKDIDKEFIAKLRIEIINHQGSLAMLTTVIAKCGSNINSLNSGEKEAGLYVMDLEITCRDRIHLADIIRKIKVMVHVQRVIRNK
ncbi:bifunctional GTP diphosphokinase/guanosine-3',5'-bis pyrophosphate 3'-pyrophosphohydrolase [Colwellia sp. 4_MG-2023]|uniref:bifunctional GTP diphosphokinase/guanosine-3',5'-bis pyrophosphate 3'-pyrophosphohydrolase n=1 Tax=unclassified Colwellia TaxID=196834 RepID=UPI001C09BE8E|nr:MULTISPECIES: bifunctional GTP diphosphokinase/guanosine-3',5'-bis pyrophosphate 3'-pyrophosphohydrolase [unclassified Colwellia]MBU2923645.1 bifunctional GTP diphosphokinase/guanosine-3',5'-bis pyrophosphate 3'-pyrophosphohydrolase [Colwellia sp. C2M11]MDO6486212.1 bifunctional GTP diphosphokinase/guanosine-3',5'-bis pyrophosphate 3'-pyrophosphohydrolase [Colwellia sp. 6_MG-2023]MDO6505832.1 bifunctional GTP diphosphokinase/guanosine-3',5'-bis pyrophosphate 3'-pyrophosphohydrolase [Colwellia